MSHEVRVERLIDASPGEVFDAFVDPEAQREWYQHPDDPPGWIVRTECNARVGGLWTSAWGPREEELYRETCVFRVVERPRCLVMTSTATAPDGTTLDTRIEVTFEEEGGRTRMTVVQKGFPTDELRDLVGGGWPSTLERLERAVRARVTGSEP